MVVVMVQGIPMVVLMVQGVPIEVLTLQASQLLGIPMIQLNLLMHINDHSFAGVITLLSTFQQLLDTPSSYYIQPYDFF